MNESVKFIFLSKKDITDLGISIRTIIDLIENGLAAHGKGLVENPPKPGIHPLPNTFIHAMPAYFKDKKICGIKWVSGFPNNRIKGLPQIIGIIILNDCETGAPICVLDGTWITAVRTAAVSAITAKFCARMDSKVLGIIGAGVQGRHHLIALKEVIPNLQKVKVYDIDRTVSEKYRLDLMSQTNVLIEICNDVESTVRESDIIVTATQRLDKPLVKNAWFEKGALGMGLEASRAWDAEAILNADKFITDDWEQTKYFKTQGAFSGGLPKLYAELGEIVCGKKPGRENPDERIIAINIGLALEDIIVANYIYEIAKKRNIGIKLALF